MSTQFFKFFIFIFSALLPSAKQRAEGLSDQASEALSNNSRISSGVNRWRLSQN